jgi:glycosyltransferase involved in cell wall biosynthesis
VRLGIIGRVTPYKQHKLLIEALHLLNHRLPERRFCLCIVGNKEQDQYGSEVAAAVDQFNLQEVVKWSGYQQLRDEIYADLDIIVAPAIGEAFGLTAIEAGAYGLPVVAARSGGFPETVVDGITGILFTPGNAGSLADALAKLILDESLRKCLGRAAREHVGCKFSEQRMATSFIQAVRSPHP